jgi:peptidyl-prolyl cis-trans isomerase D
MVRFAASHPSQAGYFAMFDAVRNNKRIVQFFLLLIIVPFAFWGVDSLMTRNSGGVVEVAKVGDVSIPLSQFQDALREQQNQMRAQLPPGVDPALLDSPEMRDAVLKGLVNQQLLLQESRQQRLLVSIDSLKQMIAAIPAVQENGQFSQERYTTLLAGQGMTPEIFESRAIQDLQVSFLRDAVASSAFTPQTVTRRLAALQLENREVQEFLIAGQSLSAEIKLDPAEAEKFYADNQARFSQPEQIRVEYVVLEDSPEERRASHILLATGGAEEAKVKAEAERILAEAQKNPARFADLAKQYSQDPGSAAKGGDLGFFPRGAMVKPFDEAVFALKEGELSGLVQTDFGFHIIRLTGVKPGRFGDKTFAEVANNFSDQVFNEPDSLKPTAETFKLDVRQSGWLTRQSSQANGALDNPKLLEAIFDDEVIKKAHNSKAVEVVRGVMVSARLLEHRPAAVLPFEPLKAGIEAQLKQERAVALAAERGKAYLETLKKGETPKEVRWGASQNVARVTPGKLDYAALRAVFKTDAKTLPAYVGAEVPDVGYALYKVNKATAGQVAEEELQDLGKELASIAGRAQLEAYAKALRQRFLVIIQASALEQKE